MKRFCIRWDERPRFVCDVHLAKLARDLRLLGFDTMYSSDISDDDLIGRCRCGRIGLTCDRRLQERAPLNIVILKCEDSIIQIRRLAAIFDLARYALPFRRSLCCNRTLVSVKKSFDIPIETYRWLNGYWRCPKCKKLYWRGTHAIRMRQKVSTLLDYQKKR